MSVISYCGKGCSVVGTFSTVDTHFLIRSCFNPFQLSVEFHIETTYLQSKINDWFLYEMQYWTGLG